MDLKTLFVSADGRIDRRTFWIGFAAVMVASLLVNLIPVAGQFLGLILLWPQICIHAKRLHDMGWTAWIQVAPVIVLAACTVAAILLGVHLPSSGSDVAAAFAAPTTALALLVAPWLVALAFVLWVGLTPGELHANEYGEPPARLA